MSWGRTWGSLGLDLAVCAALVAFGVEVTTRSDLANGTFVDTLLLPVVVAPVLVRRRWPFAAAVALFAMTVLSGLPTFDQFRLGLAIPVGMLVALTLAARCELRRALAGLAFVLAGMVFVGETDIVLRGNGGVANMILFSFPLCLAAWVAGRIAWSRDRLSDRLAAQSRLLERQRELTAQLAVEVERTRLASELDAAARGQVRALIALADDAVGLSPLDPEEARETFGRIERMGRDALNEMRDLLGVLRSDERGSRNPRPTLAEIETLLADARAGGRFVDLDLHGERRPLPLGVELATYRVLQHALSALDDAPDALTTVTLRYLPDELELELSGVPKQDETAQAALAAARERVLAHGGRLRSSGAADASGMHVLRASFPVVVKNG